MPSPLGGLSTFLIDRDVAPSAPLVVAMHGIGADERDLVPAYAPLASHAVLAFPRGPLEHPPGYSWYGLIRPGMPDPASLEAGLSRLAAWLDALRGTPGHDDRPLILSGFSQGAAMALSYALRQPTRVAGVMAFSGYVPASVLAALPEGGAPHAPRAFMAHGQRDPVIPFGRLEETIGQLAARGIQATAVAHTGGHELPAAVTDAAFAWLGREFSMAT